ncbi:hypothetical protein HYN48_04800 [Flavobacterium magnum]|uniref:VWFA domain-containing protein n=1 Tax=Flavobacterium magnum TaxID=2162713 RepID=A0A2S0RD46_9FLAO|nr:VWA domain-containing protein [Flavobacterium magnum]AWA29459.1 hypothetical protein HYN48_04800 [Flavobacterium magnum]
MQTSLTFSAVLLATTLSFAGCKKDHVTTATAMTQPHVTGENTRIQVALLLDTSNSMDGLIDQAKSRLWNIVNTLTTLKYSGKSPEIEISLYEYGNDGLSAEANYIRQVTPLTTDLDLISEKLFSLRTNGGSEYCGAVISDATRRLQWSREKTDMKLLYIAGNEAFDQGGISYKESVADALKNDIFVNTIFCGNAYEGINTHWKDGADRGNGKYFNINSDEKVRYIVTPYDERIYKCNERLNATYIGYGKSGKEKKMAQLQQDANAETVSKANYAERTVSKSKMAYKNANWDLVDKAKDDKEAVTNMKKEELPEELQGKTKEELRAFIDRKTKERSDIQKEIAELAVKREAFINTESKKTKTQDDLGKAISQSIIAFAEAKGYTSEK